ncbi:hypothetical protein [Vibrio navarrensis]|uniref:DUF4376 domain-containing protein n=1 Tax=Vibrio navarrensis TaxID=29495 RepID=UPI001558D726|nr:hypothetical protein [Vibrio navarrensis]
MMIDTNYASLAEVDENIRHYYSEDTRERVVGYAEPNEEGESSPIVEPYTVVVLNQPDKVTYQDVEQRRSERKSWESVIKPELERAIAWEEFNVNHNQYLNWLDALALWEKEQPTEPVWNEEQQEYIEAVIPAPERPLVDVAKQEDFTHDLMRDIAAYHADLAIQTRKSATFSDIEYHGKLYQMGQGKDGLFGIDNFNKRIAAVAANPDKAQESIDWIAKSNEIVSLTYEDVRAIVNAFYDREQAIFTAYNQWRSGDRLTPFKVTI